ncbi:MAG: hypothetical protein IK066_11990 [Kiritimatiellae bacterium]|nr:hypothetical protein [Kiritimatiellia bacterium]
MRIGIGARAEERGRLTLVTGPIRSGKSTWVRGEMARRGWRGDEVRGFRTYWMGDRGMGGHLELATWDGRVLWQSPARHGGGPPDGEGLADAALRALEEGARRENLAIDELGVLEAGNEALRAAVREACAKAASGIVVVQERALGVWREML